MERVARLIVRHPVTIVVTFVVAWVAAAVVHVRGAYFDFSIESMAPHGTPEYASYQLFGEHFGLADQFWILAFRADDLISAENLRLIETLTERIEALPDTESVTTLTNVKDIRGLRDTLEVVEYVEQIPDDPRELAGLERRLGSDRLLRGNILSDDGHTVALVGRLEDQAGDPDRRRAYFDQVFAILSQVGGSRRFHMAGIPFMDQAMMRYVMRDTALFLTLAITAYGAILWLSFRRWRAVWIPLVAMGFAATATMGTLSLFGLKMTVLTQWGSLSTLILVIAASDAVHLLNRYEEDLITVGARDHEAAIASTVVHIGNACMLTSLTTGIGFLSLAVADLPTVRDFGIFGAVGIFYAYLVAILFLPAALLLLDRRHAADPRPSRERDRLDTLLAATARAVSRWRRPVIASGVAVIAISLWLSQWLEIDSRFARDFKSDDPAVVSQDFLEANFGGAFPLEILVDGGKPDAIKDPELLADIDYLQKELEKLPDVTRVVSPVEFVRKMNRAMHEDRPESEVIPESRDLVAQYLLLFEMAGGDAEFARLVSYDYSIARLAGRLNDIPPAAYRANEERIHEIVAERFDPTVEVSLSGGGPLFTTVTERLISTLVRSLLLAMPLIFFVIGLTFRSSRLGIISVVPNLIPLLVAFGFMGAAGLSFKFSTIIAFPVAFGIAVDDTIHFLARYRSELAAGLDDAAAVTRALRTAGRAMVFTTVMLIGGFAVMLTSSFLAPVHLGLLTIVILISALFGDLVVLPALVLTFPSRRGRIEPGSSAAEPGSPGRGPRLASAA